MSPVLHEKGGRGYGGGAGGSLSFGGAVNDAAGQQGIVIVEPYA
ncbi:hypothetical protein [Streptomyces sp. NPDC001604]